MKPIRALVVEDDKRVVPSIEDVLFSLGHEYDGVTNQADAQRLLASVEFDYVLLDLQIPARCGRGGASAECGLNLLRWMSQRQSTCRPPVIIMTGQANACVDLTRELLENGACEFIAKPFPAQGRTLAQVIRSVSGDAPAADVDAACNSESWMTVSAAATLLQDDLPGLSRRQATARVSKAASRGKFITNGKQRTARRIDPISFAAWRLTQRDRDLEKEDRLAWSA